jgi:hypothetical protein
MRRRINFHNKLIKTKELSLKKSKNNSTSIISRLCLAKSAQKEPLEELLGLLLLNSALL